MKNALMRPILLLVVVMLFASGCGVKEKFDEIMDAQDGNLRKRVAVVPFTSGLENLNKSAEKIGAAMESDLKARGGIVVVDFAKIRELMTLVDPAIKDQRERVVMACRQMGVSALVLGILTDLSVQRSMTGVIGFRENTPFLTMELDLQLIDVSTGSVLADKALQSSQELSDIDANNLRMGQAPSRAMEAQLESDLVAPSIKWAWTTISAMRWCGFVLAVDGPRLQITIGRDTGMSVGDEVVVYSKGEKITTGSGNVIHLLGPVAGVVRLIELGPRNSWATPVQDEDSDKKPGPFEPGQVVLTK